MSEIERRLSDIEKRQVHIEKQLEKTVRERELTLKEKFLIHDKAQGLLRWFEEIVAEVPHENVWFCQMNQEHGYLQLKRAPIKDLKEIVKNFTDLVDNALGVKFP